MFGQTAHHLQYPKPQYNTTLNPKQNQIPQEALSTVWAAEEEGLKRLQELPRVACTFICKGARLRLRISAF